MDYVNGDRASYVGTIFRGRVVGGKLRADKEEILELRYFSRAELIRAAACPLAGYCARRDLLRAGPADFQRPTWQPVKASVNG